MNSFFSNNQASIWAGFGGPDTETDVLRTCCGVDYYDLDFQEIVAKEAWEPASLGELLSMLSFSDSFLENALQVGTEKGITNPRWLIMQLRFAYDPAKVTRPIASDPVFLGCFSWHE